MFKPGISNEEFNTSMLPHNRREVFFEVVKYHWVKFLLLGVIVFLFALLTNLAALLCSLILVPQMLPNIYCHKNYDTNIIIF